MRKLLLIFVLILACSGFAYYRVELAEQHVFDYRIDEVERQYYGDQWILEIRCGDYVYLFVDDIIDFNTIELPSQTDIISCGDSIISITWFEEGSDTFCEFNQIYPEDHPISVIEGMKFDHCIWSDSLNSIVYFAVEYTRHFHYYLEAYDANMAIFSATPLEPISITGFADNKDIENIEYYNGYEELSVFSIRSFEEHIGTTSGGTTSIYQDHNLLFINGVNAVSLFAFRNGYYRQWYRIYELEYDRDNSGVETIIGKSLCDLNDDSIVDFPVFIDSTRHISTFDMGYRYNEETGEWEDYAETTHTYSRNYTNKVVISNGRVYNYERIQHEKLYLGYFLGNSEPVFILDDRCYYGENLTQYLPLTYCSTFDSTTDINITDINNDGIHELFGIQNNKLNIFNVKSQLHIEPGWNLVSFPEFEYPVMISSLMPFSLTGFCYYDPVERAYSMEAVADENKPVFMMSMESRTIDLPPYEQLTSFTLNLVPGWNMIGSRNLFVKSEMLTENPAIAAPIYEYDTETSSYIEADILLPTKGYWVLANDSLEITVP